MQLDDELSGHEARLVERHLGRCGLCAAFAADVRGFTELLREAPLEPAPQFLLLRRPAATRVAARVAAVTAAAAAAVLVAVSTVSLQGNASRQSGTFDFWPTGLAVDQHSDGNLGVRHVAVTVQVPAAPGAGTRRGVVTST